MRRKNRSIQVVSAWLSQFNMLDNVRLETELCKFFLRQSVSSPASKHSKRDAFRRAVLRLASLDAEHNQNE